MSDRPAAEAAAAGSEMPAQWYELATADHFWVEWRLRVCRRLLADAGLPTGRPLRGLEIGCGRGILQRQLADSTAWTIDGCDLNRAALADNDSTAGHSFFYDIHERRADLHQAYDFLVLFDVLEHIADVGEFLDSALFHLEPGGFALINVPALMALYSRYDEVVGHLHRYRRRKLAAALERAGLAVLEIRYWGLTMLPLLAARRLISARQRRPEAILASGFQPPGRAFSAAMRLLMRAEMAIVRRPPLGSSLMAVARKPGDREGPADRPARRTQST